MPAWFVSLLRCPRCRSALAYEGGQLRCAAGHCYRVCAGVPRFVPDDAYAENFSLEWARHRTTQLDTARSRESEDTFIEKTGLRPAEVAGRTILDAGCGMGRFADVVSRWGGRVVGVDISYAVHAARQNLGDRDRVAIAQADLFALPFAPETFDIVYSIGVLHHTPDPERAFHAIASLVKRGGTLAVWVYDDNPLYQISDVYRRLTTRLPRRLLYALSQVSVPLYYLHRLPILGKITRPLLPISMHASAEWRILDTFDWYSPVYQSKHTYPEVAGWFEAAGFTGLKLLTWPVAIRGVRATGRL